MELKSPLEAPEKGGPQRNLIVIVTVTVTAIVTVLAFQVHEKADPLMIWRVQVHE